LLPSSWSRLNDVCKAENSDDMAALPRCYQKKIAERGTAHNYFPANALRHETLYFEAPCVDFFPKNCAKGVTSHRFSRSVTQRRLCARQGRASA
jgi:hypothetical protein